MRILRIVTRLAAGGPPRHCLLLTRAFERLGHETCLVHGDVAQDEQETTWWLRHTDPLVRVPEMKPGIDPMADLRALVRLRQIIRDFKPDVVHTHTAKAGALGRIAAASCAVKAVVHTYHGHVLEGYFSPVGNWLVRLAERYLAGLSHAILALSESQAETIGRHLGEAGRRRLHVVPLGMPLTTVSMLPLPPERPVTVGWFGRMVPIKNIPLLCEVIERTCAVDPQIRFLLAGDGPWRDALNRLAGKLPGRVEVHPWQADITPLLARCHFLLLTSKNEGTPVTLIEGLAAGRPFVSTRAGGVVDLAAEGQHGLLCDDDPLALMAAVVDLAADREGRRRMGSAGRRFAVGEFSETRLVEQLERLYRSLLSGSKVSSVGSPRLVAG